MSGFRNSSINAGTLHLQAANRIRRNSITALSERESDYGRSPSENHYGSGDVRKKIDEENPECGLAGQPDQPCKYDCVSNPAPWWHQITLRALFVGAILGTLFSIIIHKLSLTTGIIPSLNIAAGLIGFVAIKGWVSLLKFFRFDPHDFTPQENTVVQTCIVACSSLAFAGGFGCYLLSMDHQTFENLGDIAGNRAEDVYEPSLERSIPYLLCVGIIGIFTLVILRKRFIIDYRLQYPSGTATGILIASFHTPKGEAAAREQVKTLGYWGTTSFLFSFFKWFFGGSSTSGASCGFSSWPTFGMAALNYRWSFDFSLTYIGVGMIVPYVVAYSMMWGAIVSWGIMWPLLAKKEGDWFPAGLTDGDFRGLFGYKNFLAIAIFVADGAYNFAKIGILSLQALRLEALRDEVFLKGCIPWWIAAVGYGFFSILSIVVIPILYPPAKWYYLLVLVIVSPLFAVANAYGAGLTDFDMSSIYGTVAIFAFAAWTGSQNGGVIAALAVCGLVMASTSSAALLMQDFKTGHITMSSPRSMFLSQIAGALMGCFIAPLTFQMYWKSFPIGVPSSEYIAPYANIYRGMAIIGTQGFGMLPQHCGMMMACFFAAAIVVNLIRDALPQRYAVFVPVPMAMAIPFYIGANVAIDICIGAVVKAYWHWTSPGTAELKVPAAASGLIAGDGIWTVPSAILSICKVNPPICMSFTSS
ncbi:OPT superfamily oligopeptide transporter [Coccomyxa subellipsoidea C-169]|uniref:OPT superfamily oligopeptide transporter n=1 Tax=Coccomyxa subellipsoidea (strain C-169) TaxID=574566 RepID=I0YK29_COCSC|nr:OPT superfamily oligopeptide transporter [Coccomyxa subellipsoidea C-169]EIE18748.1 OPT superfamily oligopeptide transporter [Coccomyxa subellipsoidea C-169]|eukprot:XP_005643292.1 OPT superfamily oligopeptide transporter [Coccomyxa subellipsoidea C-169]